MIWLSSIPAQLREAARLVDHWFGTWSAATPPGNSVTLPA
jgi:hypothetical protein